VYYVKEKKEGRIDLGNCGMIAGAFSSTSGKADSVLTTKGDLATYSTTRIREGVGTNNYTLMADSAQATGIKWGASATSTLTTAGDLLVASGANTLARLAATTSGYVLTAQGAGVAPAWAAAGGGDFELLDEYTAGSAASVHNFTGSWDLANDYVKLIIEVDIKPTAAFILGVNCNSQGSGNYWGKIIRNSTTLSGATGGGSNIIDIAGVTQNFTGSYTYGTIELSSMRIHSQLLVQARISGNESQETYTSGYATLGDPVITDIELFSNTGTPRETWDAGSEFTLYGIKRS